MTNVTMLAHNRPLLTAQAIKSLRANTSAKDYRLTVLYDRCMDDAGMQETMELLDTSERWINDKPLGTGGLRNIVINCADVADYLPCIRPSPQYIYISDNDVCFLPEWLDTLIEAYDWARATHGVIALGAYNHPYNGPFNLWPFFSNTLNRVIRIGEVHALSTQSWLWRGEDWDRFGPFIETPVGAVCQGDDVNMGERIKAAGGKLAALYPPMIANCGVTNSFGERIPGYDEVMREFLPKGAIRE